ncbi:tetratricopeptide repeat protein, partial [Ichthyophthirius multifiliis]
MNMNWDMFDGLPDDYVSNNKMTEQEWEDTTNYLKNHPLFLKQIPENIENNPDLVALQNLIYDDEPENIAKNCKVKQKNTQKTTTKKQKERGNDIFKKGTGKRYFIKEALKTYTEGIDAQGKDKEINAILYNNRALMNIQLKNFGKAIDDCKQAILQVPYFTKAYYRKAQVEQKLRKYQDCIETLKQGLVFDKNNKEMINLQKQVEQQLDEEEKKKIQTIDQKKIQVEDIYSLCLKKNIVLGKKVMDFPETCK